MSYTQKFQWSTSEQVWPFEKAADGSTLYCKQVNFGTLPNNGTKTTAHNISSLTLSKVNRFYGAATDGTYLQYLPQSNGSTYDVVFALTATDIYITTFANYSSYSAVVYIIYSK